MARAGDRLVVSTVEEQLEGGAAESDPDRNEPEDDPGDPRLALERRYLVDVAGGQDTGRRTGAMLRHEGVLDLHHVAGGAAHGDRVPLIEHLQQPGQRPAD